MRARNAHGVTLVEVLVAVAASSIVLVSVLAAVKGQQDAYKNGQRVREAQGSARNALLYIEQKVALAGWGMDPVLAFDLSGQPGDTDATVWYSGPCPADATPCVKDRMDGSDELVFHSRNPNYWIPRADQVPAPSPSLLRGRVWQVLALDAANDQITINGRAGDLFLEGQILQGVCDQGQGQVYFTVADTTGADVGPDSPPLDADQELTIGLVPDVLGDPFKRQTAAACQPSRVFQIDRYRFHVRPVALGNGRFEPYLVLDRGLDVDHSGTVDAGDEALLAPGVEIMQVAYEFTPGSGLDPVGRTPGTPITIRGGTSATATLDANRITRTSFAASADEADTSYYENASFYSFRFSNPLPVERTRNHQANLGAVQVLLVTRSTAPNMDGAGSPPPGPQAPVLNMNTTPAWIQDYVTERGGNDGYERIRLETTVNVSNMVARRLLYD
jgi:type IV pilus assembly protein PilW